MIGFDSSKAPNIVELPDVMLAGAQLALRFESPSPTLLSTPLDAEARLRELLSRDLSFDGEKVEPATHGLHAFAAKFPPVLPRAFINALTLPGELVFDPMAGSGTTLVEAILSGRRALGTDLDPLATLISHIKTASPDRLHYARVGVRVLHDARQCRLSEADMLDALRREYRPTAVEFFEYWFEPPTIAELYALIHTIRGVSDMAVRAFLEVVFSSIIITKSGQLTRARDLAHSRPHRDPKRHITHSAFQAFKERLDSAIQLLGSLLDAGQAACVVRADARKLPIRSDTADLIVTSPPYAANAIDYMRAHKFSLIWLGHDPAALSKLRRQYIGSELRTARATFESDTANRTLHTLRQIDARRAAVIAHYFEDMEAALKEMLRVLRPGRAAVLVVGPSTIRGVEINVPVVLSELATSVGFNMLGVGWRRIARNARMMPVSHASERSGIEARMHEEGVIGLIKPPGDTHALIFTNSRWNRNYSGLERKSKHETLPVVDFRNIRTEVFDRQPG
ncbi:MAG: DNA methyltransferase, partial [Aggregatilineales bacterium]